MKLSIGNRNLATFAAKAPSSLVTCRNIKRRMAGRGVPSLAMPTDFLKMYLIEDLYICM